MQDIKSFTLEELKNEMAGMGEKTFRAKQIYQWMHGKLARSFDDMTDLPLALRQRCASLYEYTAVKAVKGQEWTAPESICLS